MSKRIAVFSDVHGNLHALQAMYADSLRHSVDEYWFIGDLLMPGPGVMEIWQLIKKMQPSVMVRGNWDDLTVKGVRGQMDLEKPSRIYFARLAQYVGEHVSAAVIDEIASWPLHVQKQAGKLTFGISHNLPTLNMGQALFPTNPVEHFDQLFENFDQQDVAIYAHVHHSLMRYASDERLILNPGSVGEPFNGWWPLQHDTRAHYLILEVDDDGIAELDYRHVPYDRESEYELAVESDIPYLELYKRTLETGRVNTHDQELLDQINRKWDYLAEYQAYAKRVKKRS